MLVFALFGCAGEAGNNETTDTPAATTADQTADVTAEPVELVVFAAASLTETITEIIEMYKDVAPNVTITVTFDSSGTLKTQDRSRCRLRRFPLRGADADECAGYYV
jgi:molybdate transport system substrate-binding protein